MDIFVLLLLVAAPSFAVKAFPGVVTYYQPDGTHDVETALTTAHSVTFTGSKGVLYTFNLLATDAAGNTSTSGPFQHQND